MLAASSSQWQASPSMQGELSAFLAQHGWSARVEAHEWSRSIAHDPTKKAVASSGKEPTSPRVTLPKLPQSPRRSDFSKPSPVSASGRAQQADEKIRDDPIARARRRGSSHAAPPLGCRCRVMSMEPSPSPTLAEAAVDHKAALSLSLSHGRQPCLLQCGSAWCRRLQRISVLHDQKSLRRQSSQAKSLSRWSWACVASTWRREQAQAGHRRLRYRQ